ncbi:hypothetical protein QNM97_10410 [Gordonia sp. L191]|uniref:hypothetical protein n=1 Tax=Gordonia sp. L191 TaxID=2982699 RepID=UPI0024C0818A|nr:hypothetical protein [Gordonia sp. L191]WHU49346.1 hypothetical protein QNM97_10410 [Gordonia sp. L191]
MIEKIEKNPNPRSIWNILKSEPDILSIVAGILGISGVVTACSNFVDGILGGGGDNGGGGDGGSSGDSGGNGGSGTAPRGLNNGDNGATSTQAPAPQPTQEPTQQPTPEYTPTPTPTPTPKPNHSCELT